MWVGELGIFTKAVNISVCLIRTHYRGGRQHLVAWPLSGQQYTAAPTFYATWQKHTTYEYASISINWKPQVAGHKRQDVVYKKSHQHNN